MTFSLPHGRSAEEELWHTEMAAERCCPRWAQPQGTPAATGLCHPSHGQDKARPGLGLQMGMDNPGKVETGLLSFNQLCTQLPSSAYGAA